MIVERDPSGRRRRSYLAGNLPTGPGQTPVAPAGPGLVAPGPDFQPRQRFFTAANYTSLLLALAALLSLLAHGVMVKELAYLPLARIDPDLIGQSRELIRIERAPTDVITQDIGVGDNAQEAAPSLTDLSQALLTVDPKTLPAGEPSAFPVNLRSVQDQRALDPPDLAPQVQLPPAVTDSLQVPLDLKVPFVAIRGDAPGTGSGGSGEGGVGGSAQRLLARGHLLPAQAAPPSLGSPNLEDFGPRGTPGLQTNANVPDIDFNQLAGVPALNIPINLDDDFEYTLHAFEPKADTGFFGSRDDDPRGYFRVDITAKRSLRKLSTMPKDVVFLIDVSGSVAQLWVDQVVRGVSDALDSLNPGDRFNIVFFQENPALFAGDGIRAFDDQALAEARQFLKQARSGGYTDVNRALSRLLVRDVQTQRVYNLVLISDGVPTRGVMDTRELINLITRDNDLAASIYCVGVGDRQNRQLLEFLAYRNKGFCVFAGEIGQAANSIRDLGSRLRYPILRDIRFNALGVSGPDVFPRDLPNLHQGETFSIFGRFDQRGPFTMRLSGNNGQQAYDFTFTRDLRQAQPGDRTLAEQWAFWKLHHLYSEMIRQGESGEVRQAIDALRRKYKLKTLY